MGENRIAGIGNGMPAQSIGADVLKRQEEAAGVMFADMISMSQTNDMGNFTADTADGVFDTVRTPEIDTDREKPTDAYEKYQYKDKTIRTETSDGKPDKLEETVAEVKEFEEAVTEVVTEEFHVSKEELEAAMEELGLTFLDLLDNSNLAQLAVKLTGSENINQLLCNEAFTNVLQQVSELGAELMAEVQMSPEELTEFQKVLEQQMTTDTVVVTNQEAETGQVADEVSDDLDLSTDVETDAVTIEYEENDMDAEEVFVDTSEENQRNESEENSPESEQSFGTNVGKRTQQVLSTQGNENVVVNATQNTTFAEQLEEVETVQTLPPNVTVSDIMEQITEHTRVLVSTDTSKIEMQLNPENLGKLLVEVTEKEGSVTAKFQTQNAAVKEVLEMQIADLKMNLNQAGVKVDSVEVTIASHEFERNLEQDANSQKQQEETAPKTQGRRNINLNSLDELSGLMTEEETLVAQMMAEQGNSVNFTA